MPTRPDLRDLTTGVRDAFADADRETLLDVLSFVVKEYVVDGPPPMMIHQVETLGDLASLSFAQLIAALQTRFEHPELAMFAVDGEHVSVRVGGVMQPLVASRAPVGAPPPAAAELPRPAAGVRVVEATLAQSRPAPVAAPAPAPTSAPTPAAAPRPTGGVSLRGRPSDGSMPAPSAPASPPATPAPAAAPSPAAAAAAPDAKPDKPGHSGDDASARFSLLELD